MPDNAVPVRNSVRRYTRDDHRAPAAMRSRRNIVRTDHDGTVTGVRHASTP